MTKQHFIQLAQRLATTRPQLGQKERLRQWENDLTVVAQVCEAFNPAFDRDKFFERTTRFADQLDKITEERQ